MPHLYSDRGNAQLFVTCPGGQVGPLNVDEWRPWNGSWSHFRWLNGNETSPGRGVQLYPGDLKMQRVRLPRY